VGCRSAEWEVAIGSRIKTNDPLFSKILII